MTFRQWLILMVVVMAGVTLSSCSITRRIPEGSYMLKRNVVEADREAPRRERITAGELDGYVQQSTNRHFLGTNLYAWLYAQANPEKETGWNRFLRRIGQEPVVWDPQKSERSAEYLKTYVASRGFFDGDATYRVDTLRNKKVRVRYSVTQGRPSRIGAVKFTFRDTTLRDIVMADSAATLLRTGDIFDIAVLDAERTRITSKLRDVGYYDFNANDVTYIADSTAGNRVVDLEMVVRRRIEGYREDGSPVYNDHRVYRMRDIFVRPDYDPLGERDRRVDTMRQRGLNIIHDGRVKVWPRLLRRVIRMRTDSLYSASDVTATSAEMMRMGAFRSVSVIFNPVRGATDTLPTGLLDVDIRGVAGLRQSFGVDLEASTTSNFYGLRTTLGYQNRNLFRGAELFDASFTAGFEFLREGTRKLSYELGGSVSLSFPRFVFWWVERSPKIKTPLSTLTLSANWQDRVYYSRALFGLSWGYNWGIRRFENFTLRPIEINLIDMGHIDPKFQEQLRNPYLVASYDDQLVAGISASYVFNNQPRNLKAGAVVLRINVETKGNLLSGLAHAFGKPAGENAGYYNIFGIRFSQYVRGDLSFSQKIVLGEKTALAYRLQGGAIYSYGNSMSPPFDKLFFAGGVNSMRGWAVRTLGPGTQLYEKQNYPAQMGDVKLEANLEFRFPVVGSVGGALFFDAGNIWFMRSKNTEYPAETVFRIRDFYKQLGLNTGLGVRVDLRVVVLRLDWGIQLHSPNRPVGERWIHDFRWGNTALSFGVGYPF